MDILALHERVVAHKNRIYSGLAKDVTFEKDGEIRDVVEVSIPIKDRMNTAVVYRYVYTGNELSLGVECVITPHGDYVVTKTCGQSSSFDSVVMATIRFLQHGFCQNCHSLLKPIEDVNLTVCRECGYTERIP